MAVAAWALLVLCHYLRDCGAAFLPFSFNLERWFRRAGIFDVLLVAWLWGVAASAGATLLKSFRLEPRNGAERLALCSAGGLSILSLIVMVLGGLKGLYPWVAYAILLTGSICFWLKWTSVVVGDLRPPQAPPSTAIVRLGRRLTWLLIGAVLLVVLVSALGPELEWDAVVVHLFAAKTYVQGHGIRPIPDIPQTFFPRHVTMLFTFGMLLHNETTARLIHYLLGVLTLIAAYGFGRRFFSRDAALISVGILISSPLFIWEMRTAHTELGLTLYVFLSLMAALVWLQNGERSWLTAAVYFLAFSQGTKYHAIFALCALTCVVTAGQLLERQSVKAALCAGWRVTAFGALGLVPWAVDNAIHARNPFFPFLNGVFASPYWNSSLTEIGLNEMADSGISLSLHNGWKLLTLGWQMVVNDNARFHGNLGPFYLILIPLLAFGRQLRREVWLILGFSGVYGLLWLMTGQHARYLLPLLPALAVVSASALIGWLNWCQSRKQGWIACGSALVFLWAACLVSPFAEDLNGGAQYGSGIWQTLPWRVLTGQETREDYLTRHIPSFPLVQLLNKQAGPKRILFWWNTSPSAFYADADAGFNFSPYFPRLLSDQEQQLLSTLSEYRVTHVLVAQLGQEAYLLTDPERAFAQKHLRPLGQKNAHVLYEFSMEALRQDKVTYDFLSHIQEAQIKMPGPGKENTHYRRTSEINGDQRQILLMFPPSEARFHVSIPPASAMRFAVGLVSQPSCSAPNRFEVWVTPQSSDSRRLFFREVDIQRNLADRNWLEAEIDMEPFAGQSVDILLKSFQTGPQGCDWNAWSDLRIVSRL
ncbi:MAG TPA: glycosyltransferase family 39 protein [Terriglobia bacterium]|nr:glycosyltransferase family 39 protein [Terriglobia bacterium]